MSYLDNFNYQMWGNAQAPKLVFLHGLMGSAANWRKIVGELQGDYHMLAYDQRGHGRSFQPDSGYATEDFADDLKKILDELGWDSVFLVGHSMGGRNALNFAYRFPERTKALVIEDIGPEKSQEAVGRIERLLGLVPTPFMNKKEAREFFRGEFQSQLPHNPQREVLAQYFYSNIEEKETGRADWRFSKEGVLSSLYEGRAKDRWHEVKGLQVPTLWIRGDRSEELPRAIYQEVLESNPLIQGVEIAHAGHWAHFEQWQVFVDSLKNFLTPLWESE